ncbi:mannose-6-phosphate isomerase [Pseudovibrio japonicus]|uniref:Mannose-6-phosphate isomerase n=1 Tax=Pseudovibrio japonicus TaxID=366534 RepID=A0ABQ3EJH1_9HYPH|nr:cupin domain-containing protein [Pseudovibrio japonicus]GHB43080.1 mannose-6-phosphate isomerase [Pseudovibrio japonicus]
MGNESESEGKTALGVPKHLRREDWATGDGFWRGRVEGKDIGTQVTVLFFSSDRIGAGPPLHVHKYDEVFIVRTGRAEFTVGDDKFIAEKGAVIFGPANIPHKFENVGPGPLETTDIHLSDHFEQVVLE